MPLSSKLPSPALSFSPALSLCYFSLLLHSPFLSRTHPFNRRVLSPSHQRAHARARAYTFKKFWFSPALLSLHRFSTDVKPALTFPRPCTYMEHAQTYAYIRVTIYIGAKAHAHSHKNTQEIHVYVYIIYDRHAHPFSGPYNLDNVAP